MKFDIAIIGGGPGGYTAAEKAAKAGRSFCSRRKTWAAPA